MATSETSFQVMCAVVEVGEVTDDLQRAPLARDRARDELLAGHPGDGGPQLGGPGEVLRAQFPRQVVRHAFFGE